jgi:cobalamin synthase
MAGALLAAGVVATTLVTVSVDGAGAWYAGLVVALVAMVVALLVQAAVAKRLGGLTGDVYGLGIELAEAAALVAGCAIVRLAG